MIKSTSPHKLQKWTIGQGWEKVGKGSDLVGKNSLGKFAELSSFWKE